MAVVGHSAGGHLAAMLLATDWSDPSQDYFLQDGHVPFRCEEKREKRSK